LTFDSLDIRTTVIWLFNNITISYITIMNIAELSSLEFLRAFETCRLDSFQHRDHIRLACIYLDCYGEQEALERLRESIRRFAAHHGKSDKYHETLTVAWLRLVASAKASLLNASFEEFSIRFPELLDKRTIEKFYSSELLGSEAARISWLEPDLQPLPVGVAR
jgi:hypothetical protein